MDDTKPLVEETVVPVKSRNQRDENGLFLPGNTIAKLGGRPKRSWTMAGLIEESLDEADETGITFKDIITRKLRSMAARGDMQAIKEVIDRIDGKSKESLDVNAQGGFTVIVKRDNQ